MWLVVAVKEVSLRSFELFFVSAMVVPCWVAQSWPMRSEW
jgi:hypothetical protein